MWSFALPISVCELLELALKYLEAQYVAVPSIGYIGCHGALVEGLVSGCAGYYALVEGEYQVRTVLS